MSIFIKTRFTYNSFWFTPQMEFKFLYKLDTFLTRYGKIARRTYGQEEASQKHIHIHYELLRNDKPLPKVIHQTFQYSLKQIKGLKDKPPIKSSSITIETTENEPGRLMQYPLKQDNSHYHLCIGYTKAELDNLHNRAAAELREHLKKKQTQDAKKDREEKTWNAICDYLDKHLLTQETILDKEVNDFARSVVRHTTIQIYYYYMEHKGCAISRSLQDKAVRYLMARGILEPEEIYSFYYDRFI